MSVTLVCRTCARPAELPPEEGGCVCAGTDARPGRPVPVASDAAEKAQTERRVQVLPAPRIPGVSAAERAHMVGDCEPRSCGRCALVAEMRGATDGATTRTGDRR